MISIHDEVLDVLAQLKNIYSMKMPDGWFAIAFNRVLHNNFAPQIMWDVMQKCAFESLENGTCYIGEEKKLTSVVGGELKKVSLNQSDILLYLFDDFKFTENHVVLSPSSEWFIYLDQDVTYFLFREKMRDCMLEGLGGFDNVEKMILHDFDGIKGRNGPVEIYVSSLLNQ